VCVSGFISTRLGERHIFDERTSRLQRLAVIIESWLINFQYENEATARTSGSSINFFIVFIESIEDTNLTCYLLIKPQKNNAPGALVPEDKMEG